MEHPDLHEARQVIDALQNEFDSHDFIEKYMDLFEHQYVVELEQYSQGRTDGIFKTYHSQIGRFLSQNTSELHIRKDGTSISGNVKYRINENAKWIKL